MVIVRLGRAPTGGTARRRMARASQRLDRAGVMGWSLAWAGAYHSGPPAPATATKVATAPNSQHSPDSGFTSARLVLQAGDQRGGSQSMETSRWNGRSMIGETTP